MSESTDIRRQCQARRSVPLTFRTATAHRTRSPRRWRQRRCRPRHGRFPTAAARRRNRGNGFGKRALPKALRKPWKGRVARKASRRSANGQIVERTFAGTEERRAAAWATQAAAAILTGAVPPSSGAKARKQVPQRHERAGQAAEGDSARRPSTPPAWTGGVNFQRKPAVKAPATRFPPSGRRVRVSETEHANGRSRSASTCSAKPTRKRPT